MLDHTLGLVVILLHSFSRSSRRTFVFHPSDPSYPSSSIISNISFFLLCTLSDEPSKGRQCLRLVCNSFLKSAYQALTSTKKHSWKSRIYEYCPRWWLSIFLYKTLKINFNFILAELFKKFYLFWVLPAMGKRLLDINLDFRQGKKFVLKY